MRVAVFVTPLRTALIVAVPPAGRLVPVTVKVPEVWPAAIVVLEGVVATFVSLDDRLTVAPAGPAGPSRVRVAVDVPPEATVVGLRVRFVKTAGVTVTVVVLATLA
ncbi:MAG: hypothetical protein DIJKHBIC_01095 [Thermoanaerobaculia bacterium]|nr:hypothetical protein [Thermoanaerobaculia bacterium]